MVNGSNCFSKGVFILNSSASSMVFGSNIQRDELKNKIMVYLHKKGTANISEIAESLGEQPLIIANLVKEMKIEGLLK